ncbi:MAG TPA: glycosyltransferase family 2 protein [Halobacteriales archaeon]|nr:glycosyltransferase family 2 protein [Halobacteriales archaeon]
MAIEAAAGPTRSADGREETKEAGTGSADRRANRLARLASSVHGEGPPDDLLVSVPEDGSGPHVVAVRHAENRGRGGAVKTGYRLALAEGMDVVVVMDGDGQMDPDNVERLVHPVATGRADYAKGNRLNSPRYWAGMSRFRLFGNVVLTGLTRVASGYWRIRDPQNGYTAISQETLSELPVDDLYEDYGFLNDVLVKLHMVDARVADVAMAAVYGDEESGIRYSSFVSSLSMLLFWNFLERLYHEGFGAGSRSVPLAYGLAVLGGVGALLLALLSVAGLTLPSPWPVVGALLGWSLLGTAVAVRLDGRRSLHLQQRVPLYDGVGGGPR